MAHVSPLLAGGLLLLSSSARDAPAGDALVIHVGNDPVALKAFERWLGCPVQGVSVHSGQASWADWSGSIGYELNMWRPSGRRIYWSIPLIPEGATLSDAAVGRFDARYIAAARAVLAGTPGGETIPVRTGWEFNTAYMPWASSGKEADFRGAFQHFVMSFRSISPRFRFEWAANIGGGDDPALSYPGDRFVDVIGMDAYYNTAWDSTDAAAAWRHNVERRYGIGWLEQFAAAHRKPTAYGEWGVMSEGAAPYVTSAASWFAAHNVVYQSYWDSDSSFRGKLSGGRMPVVGVAYRRAFGRCARPAA